MLQARDREPENELPSIHLFQSGVFAMGTGDGSLLGGETTGLGITSRLHSAMRWIIDSILTIVGCDGTNEFGEVRLEISLVSTKGLSYPLTSLFPAGF
jgi:hypothetical protein